MFSLLTLQSSLISQNHPLVHGFSQKSVTFDPNKIPNLSILFERPYKKLLIACFSFEKLVTPKSNYKLSKLTVKVIYTIMTHMQITIEIKFEVLSFLDLMSCTYDNLL